MLGNNVDLHEIESQINKLQKSLKQFAAMYEARGMKDKALEIYALLDTQAAGVPVQEAER